MDFRRKTMRTSPGRSDSPATTAAAPVTTTSRSGATVSTPRTTSRARPVSREERERMIREEAYLTAERDHFRGDPKKYWREAETRIDLRLKTLH